ncbi:MAG: thioesterase family protein [Candidatus Eremiobacteraeota bacterium]|nr:thioesterase family protein [Candidatus Eremiobacteraeota bacterium]
MPFLSEIKLQVRYVETDQMGVVHHSVYPVYFEAGRTDFFARHILSYSEFERRGIWAPVVFFTCQLRSVARYEDWLTIVTVPVGMTNARITLAYEAKKDHELIASGTSVHTFISPERKIVKMTRFPGLYEKLREVFQGSS